MEDSIMSDSTESDLKKLIDRWNLLRSKVCVKAMATYDQPKITNRDRYISRTQVCSILLLFVIMRCSDAVYLFFFSSVSPTFSEYQILLNRVS